MKRVLATLVALCTASLLAAGAASAAPQQPQTLTCDGPLGQIQVTAGPANGADQSWGAAQIVGGGHLIPLAFHFEAIDVTHPMTLVDESVTKGDGRANASGPVETCSESFQGMLGDFLDPGQAPPDGAELTDTVTTTFTATVAVKQ